MKVVDGHIAPKAGFLIKEMAIAQCGAQGLRDNMVKRGGI